MWSGDREFCFGSLCYFPFACDSAWTGHLLLQSSFIKCLHGTGSFCLAPDEKAID